VRLMGSLLYVMGYLLRMEKDTCTYQRPIRALHGNGQSKYLRLLSSTNKTTYESKWFFHLWSK